MFFRIILLGLFLNVLPFKAFTQNLKNKSKTLVSKNDLNITQKEEISEDMDRFMGFGFHFSISRDENEAENQNRDWKLSDGFKLKMGVKLPKYLKTKPPEKLIAMD